MTETNMHRTDMVTIWEEANTFIFFSVYKPTTAEPLLSGLPICGHLPLPGTGCNIKTVLYGQKRDEKF